MKTPSSWVTRWGAELPPGSTVLDVAAGRGRHARWFAERGCQVTAVDRDIAHLDPGSYEVFTADLEAQPWPYSGRIFVAVVVTNYLHRPLFRHLVDAVAEGGLLIYETFATGQEQFGRPRNPDYLLRPGELLAAVGSELQVVAYECGRLSARGDGQSGLRSVQRICAVRGSLSRLLDP